MMENDCPSTYAPALQLPRPISGLNIWPVEEENAVPQRQIFSASNRGVRRGNFVINPQWTSENVEVPRSLGAVYEPAPQDFYGARALHAKTWEQAAIYPGHGTNSHLASPGSIDPAPVSWEPGGLSVDENWRRLACDVTHYRGELYFTAVDCGPSRFAIWRRLRDESATSLVHELQQIFRERGPPSQLLIDNAAAFRSQAFQRLCNAWGVAILFRCAYRPSGNAIVERHHRTIKSMAARSGGDILDMVFWHNLAPETNREIESAPCRQLHNYAWKSPLVRHPIDSRLEQTTGYTVGQRVFVKPPGAKCTTQWPLGTVTGVGPGVGIEIDGMRRHVADVREVPLAEPEGAAPAPGLSEGAANERARSDRPRRPVQIPARFDDFLLY